MITTSQSISRVVEAEPADRRGDFSGVRDGPVRGSRLDMVRPALRTKRR
jgi:hypothetical protein